MAAQEEGPNGKKQKELKRILKASWLLVLSEKHPIGRKNSWRVVRTLLFTHISSHEKKKTWRKRWTIDGKSTCALLSREIRCMLREKKKQSCSSILLCPEDF